MSVTQRRNYIATTSESLSYFSGDCDDHSILMAASVRAMGGTPTNSY
jgi:transglutaminase-like putative cysteine protease